MPMLSKAVHTKRNLCASVTSRPRANRHLSLRTAKRQALSELELTPVDFRPRPEEVAFICHTWLTGNVPVLQVLLLSVIIV